MFRVVAEVFENQPLPATCDDVELLKKYIDKKLEKYDQEIGRNYLTEIGNALFDAEAKGLSEEKFSGNSLEESYLRKCLGLKAGDKIPQELFAYNLLTRTKNNNGLIFIGFYYTKVRDYVVSFYSLKLPHLGDAEFKSLLPSLFKGPIGLGAISWYAEIASESHSKILLDFHYARGLLFLKEYQTVIDTHMPLLKNRFDPYTDGSIGLVMVVHSDGRYTYGFRPLSEGDKIIELLDSIPSKDYLFKIGLKSERFRRDDFLTVEPAVAARAEIKEQLGKIIEEGRLNEEFNVGIAKEKAVAIIFKCSEQLGYGKIRNHYIPRIGHLLPINCDELLKRVKLIYAREYYYKEVVEEKIKSGEIQTKGDGSFVSYSVDNTQIDFDEINRKARTAVENDQPIPVPRVIGDIQIYSVLTKALETIKTESSEISEPLFPPPDIPTESIYERVISNGGKPGWIPDLVCAQYSESQLKKYIEAFFDAYLKEYQKLMEVNFPTIKNYVPYYSKLPTGFYVEAVTMGHGWSLGYAMKYDRSEPQIEVKINPDTSLAFGDTFDNWSSMGLETILWESSAIPLIHYSSSLMPRILDSISELCTLRTFIYKQIKSDIGLLYNWLEA